MSNKVYVVTRKEYGDGQPVVVTGVYSNLDTAIEYLKRDNFAVLRLRGKRIDTPEAYADFAENEFQWDGCEDYQFWYVTYQIIEKELE